MDEYEAIPIDEIGARDEWLTARHPFFNASAASVLWDRHPYLTPGEYAAEKLAVEPVVDEQTEAMERGHRLEEPLAAWFADQMGFVLIRSTDLHVRGVIACTVDRLRVDDDEQEIVEIKTTSQFTGGEPLTYWLDQCQAQMWCTGARKVWLVWMDATMRLDWTEVDRDDDQIMELRRRASEFMAAIAFGMFPDWVKPSSSDIATVYPNPSNESLELDDDDYLDVQRYEKLRLQVKALEEEMSDVKGRLAARLADHAAGSYDGVQVVAFSPVAGRTSFDKDRLAADQGDEFVKQYEKRGKPSRRFAVSREVLI